MNEQDEIVVEDQAVNPTIKAHITSLVSALGGPDITDVSRPYVLGDEALACLRDLKKWIKFDESSNRWDIARGISETPLVTFDLLEILTKWELECEHGVNKKHGDRIALACLELLVPLTWPLELNRTTSTNNHYRHAPYLFQARLKYKKAILQHPKGRVLKSIIRLAIPVLKLEKSDRTMRDEGILKLVIYFFRNILAIEGPTTERQKVDDDVSRSNTLSTFDEQDVIAFLITIAAQIGTTFTVQDTAIMECIFHMLKGLKPRDFFPTPVDDNEPAKFQPNDLKSVLSKEKEMKSSARRGLSNRHSRFGTLVSMVTDNGDRYAVSGPDGLSSAANTLNKLDANKKWKRPGGKRTEQGEVWNMAVPLSKDSRTIIENFTRDFLDAGFNPVFGSVRRLIENESDKITTENQMQFLYLVGFFLECERRKRDIQRFNKQLEADYGLVANALNQNMFIVVMKLMRECHEKGPQQNFEIVYASMVCFNEILLVIKQMETSYEDDDQEIAQNMKHRLFYEEHSLKVLAALPRIALRQSQRFLEKAVELTAVVLKTLESFSKQHTTLFVRAKRHRKSKKAVDPGDDEEGMLDDTGMDSEEESRTVTTERKFEFTRFERKYLNNDTLDAYKRYLSNYREMSSSEIMTGLWFIHRIFSHKDSRSHFFSLDFMRLMAKMTDSKDGIPKTFKARKETERFMAYYVGKLRQALERTPSLYVELLFSKLPEHTYYLDNGYDKVKPAKKTQRVAPVWEFKPGTLTDEQQHGILVAALIDDDKTPLVEWTIDQMTAMLDRRVKGTVEDEYMKGDADKQNCTKKDGKFRLLLQTLGFVIPDTMMDTCKLPRYVEVDKIETGLAYLKKYMFEPFRMEDEPDAAAGDFLQRDEPAPEPVPASEPDSASDADADVDAETAAMLPDGTPSSSRNALNSVKRKRKTKSRRPKQQNGNGTGKDHKSTPPPPPASKQYKSADFIDSEDDKTDDERDSAFFANEDKLREAVRAKLSTGATADVIARLDATGSDNWQQPADDDNVPEPEPELEQEQEEESLFVSDNDEDKENANKVKRPRRIVDDDDDDE